MKYIPSSSRLALRVCLGALLTSASLLAMASPCDSVLSSYSQGSSPNAPTEHPECFGGSTDNTTTSVKQSSAANNNAVTNVVANRFLDEPPISIGGRGLRGIAAATPGKAWNIWGNLTSNSTEQAYRNDAGNNVKNGSDGLTSVIGGDIALSPVMVIGLSASFDRSTGDGYQNGTKQNSLTNKGYMFAPYLGYSLSKQLAVDASLGWGKGDLTQSGNVTAEADRWYGGANLNYSAWMGRTQLSGKVGYLHAEERYGKAKLANGTALNGTNSTNKIQQMRLGAQAAWWMNGWMPFVGLAYSNDLKRSSSLAGAKDYVGKNAWVWSLGANFFSLASGVTGGIAYNQESSRNNSDNYQFIANISFRF